MSANKCPYCGNGAIIRGMCADCGTPVVVVKKDRKVVGADGKEWRVEEELYQAMKQEARGELSPIQTETSNPKDIIGRTKPAIALVPPSALIFLSKAMECGAARYGPYNWRLKKVESMSYLNAGLRHKLEFLDGEDIDPESHVHHLAHDMACSAILIDAICTGNLKDNRPTPGAAGRLIRELTTKTK